MYSRPNSSWLLTVVLATGMAARAATCATGMYPFQIDVAALPASLFGTLNQAITRDHAIRARNGHFYTLGPDRRPGTRDDSRVRFWGVNLTPPLTFPRSDEEAEQLAIRLAKLGFNMVRLHGLDQGSETPSRTLLDTGHYNWARPLNKSNVAALGRLLDAFQRHGIYADLNLKVAYTFDRKKDCFLQPGGAKRCVPDPGTSTRRYQSPRPMPPGSRPLDLFNREMIELQKRYVRAILERFRDHPAVALLEINNENSLIESATQPADAFPPLYAEELDHLWNEWLLRKYHTTDALRAAWRAGQRRPAGRQLVQNGDFRRATARGQPRDWRLTRWELDGESDWGGWSVTGQHRLEIDIRRVPAKSWYFFLAQRGIPIRRGSSYQLSFTARAEPPREISIDLRGMTRNRRATAASQTVGIGTRAETYRMCLPSLLDDDDGRLTFVPALAGSSAGELWLADVELVELPARGLGHDESLHEVRSGMPGSVRRRTDSGTDECARNSVAVRDYLEFLAATERDYYEEMSRFLRDELGALQPLAGTQANYGGLPGQRNMVDLMDWLDVHYYWDHPHIPKDDQARWWMTNQSMLSQPANSIVARVAETRVAGKPFVITEYSPNQANQFAQEGLVVTAAYAALQDIDGVILFNFDSSGDQRNLDSPKRQLRHWYNIGGDARAEALLHFAANLFRRGDVRAAHNTIRVHVNRDTGLEQVQQKGARNIRAALEDDTFIRDAEGRPFKLTSGLRSEVRLVHDDSRGRPTQTSRFPAAGDGPISSDTGELSWSTTDPDESWLLVDTPRSKAVTGHIGRTFRLGSLVISGAGGPAQSGTVSVTSLDGKAIDAARDLLLTTIGPGRNRNTGIVRQGRGVTLCVGDDRGNCTRPFWNREAGPFLIQANPVSIRLASTADRIIIERLDSRGRPNGTIPARRVGRDFEFGVGRTSDGTPWYRLRIQD
jgi:hypothetical protein